MSSYMKRKTNNETIAQATARRNVATGERLDHNTPPKTEATTVKILVTVYTVP